MKPLLALAFLLAATFARAAERPNIVFIVGEDMGPELGCYGDPHAITPQMDRLAREGARFTRCFTHAPVCAPSRCGLITGRYPTTLGAQHMRSRLVTIPPTFTKLLREAGYFVAWPGKTDFNFEPPADFADTTKNWLKSPPPKQPFFAYINFTQSHESQVRNDNDKYAANTKRLTPEQRRDPAKMVLPPYHPDAPEVRADLARYYDLVTSVDYDAGDVLQWLDDHKIADNTIVILFGDHGRGIARSKRWLYDSGLHTPLLVRWPGRIDAGSVREDLVAFLDLAPTCLALAGAEVPAEMPGRIFLGERTQPEPKQVFAARDFMDETPDRIRSARDRQFRYVRNFHPELPYAQRIEYMERGPTMQVWRKLHAEGKLNPIQDAFFAPAKPPEELYDTAADPWETRNLADDSQHAAKLAELRAAMDEWLVKTHDLGGMSVEEMVAQKIIKPRDPIYGERKARGSE